jgi:hypothetical protein
MTPEEQDAYNQRIAAIPLNDALAKVLKFSIEGGRMVFRSQDAIAAERWLKQVAEERGIPTPAVRC